jgi:hypothetical protein
LQREEAPQALQQMLRAFQGRQPPQHAQILPNLHEAETEKEQAGTEAEAGQPV